MILYRCLDADKGVRFAVLFSLMVFDDLKLYVSVTSMKIVFSPTFNPLSDNQPTMDQQSYHSFAL